MARRRFSEAELDALFGLDSPALSTSTRPAHPLPPSMLNPDPVAEAPSPDQAIPEFRVEQSPATPQVAAPESPPPQPATAETEIGQNTVLEIPLSRISANPHQPRAQFDETKLQEMAESIRAHGVLQPILVRITDAGYQIVAGERRVRAATLAGRESIPALVISLTDQEILEVALIENLQRDDLNPVEEARAYDYLCRQFGMSHEEVARRVGKDRTTVVNMMRLLRLPLPIKLDLQTRALSTGHARALLALDNEDQMLKLHKDIVGKGLSVRQTEDRVRDLLGESTPAARKRRATATLPPEIEDLQNRMTEAVGVRVRLLPKSETTGRIEMTYGSLDELDRICTKMGLSSDDM